MSQTVDEKALIEEYKRIHATSDWGGTSVKNLRFLLPHIRILKPDSVIDYGCGKSKLIDLLDVPSIERRGRYDPAIPEYSSLDGASYSLLLNVDVLEHVPEHTLDDVIGEMARISKDALIVVDTQPAELHLADGQNAHISLHDHAWWRERLERHFGPLHPIRVKRRGRAAFRTWPVQGGDRVKLAAWRVYETLRYSLRRLGGRKY